MGLFFPQEENLRRSVWNRWEMKEILFVVFILDGYTHSLASYPVYLSRISWLPVFFLFGSILCELLSASLITSFDLYLWTASKSLHLLFFSSEGGWHTSWYWSWIWSSVLLLVWAWPNNPAGCSLREDKHDITLGYHEMMNTGIKDKDIKRFLNGSYCPDFHCTIKVSYNAQKTS